MRFNIAVVGATGMVGEEMLNILSERSFPVANVYALASSRSVGRLVKFGEKDIVVDDLATFDYSKVDIAFFSAGDDVSKKYAPLFAEEGAVVIDNSPAFRTDSDIPLVVPEVNSSAMSYYRDRNIIANPNCAAIQALLVLGPLHKVCPIKRVVMCSMQSVSGAGKVASKELFEQTEAFYSNKDMSSFKKNFQKQIAFNLIPQIGSFLEDGYTSEEQKIKDEISKIMGSYIPLTVTSVRVPVYFGHSQHINIEFENEITEEELREVVVNASGVSLVDYRKEEGYVTPVEAAGEDNVFVSRIRKDNSIAFGYDFWVVADNIRKGAALNAVQIAEELIKNMESLH